MSNNTLAYRRRTGQLTTEDYRVERDKNFKLLAEVTRQSAVLAQQLEEAFEEVEEYRETIKKQQEIIFDTFNNLDDYLRGSGDQENIIAAHADLKKVC